MDQIRKQVLTLVRNGAYAAAVRAAFEVARKNPASPECLELLGYAEAMAGYLRAAIKTLTLAIELAPARSSLWYQRGQLRLAAGLLREAVADLDCVVRIERESGSEEFMERAEAAREEALSRLQAPPRSRAGATHAAVRQIPS